MPKKGHDVTAMGFGDIIKLTLVSTVGGQTLNNVFHYRQTIGVLGGEMLAQEFINEVLPDLKPIISSSTLFRSVNWYNYDDISDFGVDDSILGEAGTVGGETLPTFTCWAFQYNRTTRATRNGSKRFGTISENDNQNGNASPLALPKLVTAANSLGQFINLGGTEIWRPVIARLSPDGASVILTNDVRDVQYKRITTQNTRKIL